MIAHLLKPIWRRKSRHLMLSLEILLAFLLVFAVAAGAGRYFQLAALPIGFAYDSVWSVQMQGPVDDGASDPEVLDQFKRSLEALPEVEKISFASFSPYESAIWESYFSSPESGITATSEVLEVSDDFFEVVGMRIQEGRWFSQMDAAAAEQPVVINRQMANALFPGQSALGKVILTEAAMGQQRGPLKVMGVFADFRSRGEYMTPGNFVLQRMSSPSEGLGMNAILLKLEPGTPREFEVKLSERLKQVRHDWSYRIAPLTELRKSLLAEQESPLIVLSVIAVFLLVMVAFGLFGVLWQSTTQRIPEIGLRRAIGAHAGAIYRQIIIEQLLLSSLAMAAGILLLLQLPLTGAFGDNLDLPLFTAALLASMAVIYGLSILCALYPAWRVSRLSPTEALHYE